MLQRDKLPFFHSNFVIVIVIVIVIATSYIHILLIAPFSSAPSY